MKCKLSKLFFLTLMGVVSLNGYSQTVEGRKKIVKDYDLNYLNKLSKEYELSAKASYEKALAIVKEKNMPINGVDANGAYFSLKGLDSETGDVLYYKTYNNGATNSSVQTARAQHLYNGGSLGINIQGQLMILGIWDGGHPQASHQNIGVNRVVIKDGNNPAPGGQGGIDHATHVAGTMIGNGSVVNEARGIAFQGTLWSNDWSNDTSEQIAQAAQGLLVSNHSYGIDNENYINTPGIFGRYTSDSRAIDQLTSNAPNYLPVYAAGNDRNGIGNTGIIPNAARNGYDQLTHEAVSKNAVVVAAINGFTDYTTSSNVVMSSFSQWGPTDDFRIKPDISAKGVGVYSSNMPAATSQDSYASYQGTSMAAPAVTAVFALWQQYFKFLNSLDGIENMRAASLKALMAHTASEAGTYRNMGSTSNSVSAPGPDPRFGWGVINAKGGAEILQKAYSENSTAVFKELELLNGQEYVLNVLVDGTEQFNATIAWTDLPADAVGVTDSSTPLLVNDLDLRVYTPDDVNMTSPKYPYALVKNWVAYYSTKMDNDVDPIEKVNYYSDFDGLAEAGTYKVKVSHKGTLTGGSQKFTLIVSGGVIAYGTDAAVDNVTFDNLKVYPNPAKDIINISADFSTIENAQVAIYDMLGKKVFENNELFSYSGDARIDVSNFNKGVYLVKIVKDGKMDTRKIIIK